MLLYVANEENISVKVSSGRQQKHGRASMEAALEGHAHAHKHAHTQYKV